LSAEIESQCEGCVDRSAAPEPDDRLARMQRLAEKVSAHSSHIPSHFQALLLKQRTAQFWGEEVAKYEGEKHRSRHSKGAADEAWLKTVVRGGTLNDRAVALSVMSQVRFSLTVSLFCPSNAVFRSVR
jgi:hypothetical protein